MANARRLVITGHNGFVGSKLTIEAKKKGYEVLIFEGDLSESEEVEKFSEALSNLDIVIHLAGTFFGSDYEILYKNTVTSVNFAKSLKDKHGIRVILISTGAVYGDSGITAINEDTPLKPNTMYGLTKKWGEEAFQFYLPRSSLVILRLPAVYGPNNSKGVIFEWIRAIRTNSSITLYGAGEQRRSFLHVNDLCEVILLAVDSKIAGVFNCAELDSYSLIEIIGLLRSHAAFSITNLPENNPLKSMVLDPGSLFVALNWRPSHSLSEYIKGLKW